MLFQLTILGSSSATPANGLFPTSQILQIQQHWFMIDCGEGAQIRMQEYRLSPLKISHIFISHLHGDHIFGLPGVLMSMALAGRTESITIFGPQGLKQILEISPGISRLPYPVYIHPTPLADKSVKILDLDCLEVFTLPLTHSMPTTGFLFKEKPFPKTIIAEKIKEYQIPYPQIRAVKAGADFVDSKGNTIPNDLLTLPSPKSRSYAFCSDTSYNESLIPLIKEVDILYHEATFTKDAKERANKTQHSIAEEAATIAKLANVGQLLIGHFSARYKNISPLLDEARQVFPNTEAGIDGSVWQVHYGS